MTRQTSKFRARQKQMEGMTRILQNSWADSKSSRKVHIFFIACGTRRVNPQVRGQTTWRESPIKPRHVFETTKQKGCSWLAKRMAVSEICYFWETKLVLIRKIKFRTWKYERWKIKSTILRLRARYEPCERRHYIYNPELALEQEETMNTIENILQTQTGYYEKITLTTTKFRIHWQNM